MTAAHQISDLNSRKGKSTAGTVTPLRRAGRYPLPEGQAKQAHSLTFSARGWEGLTELAKSQNRSVSSQLDLLGLQNHLLQMPLESLLVLLTAVNPDAGRSVMKMSVVEIVDEIASAQSSI